MSAHRAGAWPVALMLAAVLPAQARTVDLRGELPGAGGERARVTVWQNVMMRNVVDPVAEGFAAADGTFVLRGVPWPRREDWGMNKILVVARTANAVGIVELRGEKIATDAIRVVLKPPVTLRGTLRDPEGAPIAGAWVWPGMFGDRGGDRGTAVWLTAPLLPWTATTDDRGRFALADLPDAGPWKLRAGHDDFGAVWIDVPDAARPVDGTLQRGGRIAGRVLRPDGQPAARVQVRACGNGLGYGHTFTRDDGAFELKGLLVDTYKVFAEADDLTVIAVLGIEVGAGARIDGQVVQLVHGGFIAGRLVDAETGAPIAPAESTDVAMYGPARGPGGACEAFPVRPDGTFRIRAPAGENRIYLRSLPGWDEPSELVTVTEGETTKVEWRLRRHVRRAK